jgi:hypothetical protein
MIGVKDLESREKLKLKNYTYIPSYIDSLSLPGYVANINKNVYIYILLKLLKNLHVVHRHASNARNLALQKLTVKLVNVQRAFV